MNRRRAGIVLIVLGFVAAVVAGGWLAGQAAQPGAVMGDIVLVAALAFIPVAVLVGGGIYLFQRQTMIPVAESDVQMQRRLVATVNERGQVSIEELATALQTSPQRVRDLIGQLVKLEIFPGEIDWETGVVYARNRKSVS